MEVGIEFSHYRVVEHIGRGGMADVWSAQDQRLRRTVAIKTIARDLSTEVNPVERFRQEALTIASLDHAHIVPIYDYGEFNERLYIVMRYVSGGSLEERLQNGPLARNEVLRVAEAVGRALDYAHEKKIVHLDLKPANILIDSGDSPYLSDFGLAAVIGPEGRANNPGSGTLLYMAPEQLANDVLDHRADIYSFAVMLFHMLTGELPFDATTPLALKQLQWQEELPDVTTVNSLLPTTVTDVLRRGTALDANSRPNTAKELIEDLQKALSVYKEQSSIGISFGPTITKGPTTGAITIDLSDMVTAPAQSPEAMARREAEDIYNKARRTWAHGQGRFLLGVTHFMLINGYYMNSEQHGLELDDAGMQMMLRGALEYDHEVEYWWGKLDDDNRRWVALHAIRSENAPARVRAMYRLETLPDSSPPKIPSLVAQALQVETNEQARLAAVNVLATRALYVEDRPAYVLEKSARRNMLTSQTRLGIQLQAPSEWREVTYTPEIDELIAETALDGSMPQVAELAARTVGRMRSLAAVRKIADAQRKSEHGALRALALVRDEAPSLPAVVSARGRAYAWLANTWRRVSEHPLLIVQRFVLGLIGGWLAMGVHILTIFRSQAIFSSARWGSVVAIGLVFGVLTGFMAILAGEIPNRLRGFWPWWARLALSAVLGLVWGTLAWGAYTWLYFNYPPPWELMAMAGAGMAFGFVISTLFNMPGWASVLISAVAIYTPIYVAFNEYIATGNPAILYYDFVYSDAGDPLLPREIFTVAIPFALLVATGGHAPALVADVRRLFGRLKATQQAQKTASTR